MNRPLIWTLALGVACTAGRMGAAEEEEESKPAETGFARYQTILDRMPFGEPPPNFDPTAPGNSAGVAGAAGGGEKSEAEKSAEEQRLQSAVRVSMLNVKPDGRVFVGFTDSTSKPEKHHYLAVGDSVDGWTVKSADPDAAVQEVVLEKDGIDVTLKLGSATGGKDGKAGKTVATTEASAAQSERARMMRGGRHVLRGRREEQESALAAAKAAAAKVEEERKQLAAEREAAAEARAEQREALKQIQEALRRNRTDNSEQKSEEGETE